jgi:HEAT repeat protein
MLQSWRHQKRDYFVTRVARTQILSSILAVMLGGWLWTPSVAADTDAVRTLVHTAADPRTPDPVRSNAMQQLRQQGLAAVSTLVELTQDANSNVRAIAVNALGQLDLKTLDGDAAVDVLIMVAQRDPDPIVRMSALAAMGVTGNRKALDVLVAALDSDDVRFRRRAVIGLVRLHRPEVVAPLVHRFKQEKDHEIRVNIVRTLGSLGARRELEELRQSVTETDLLSEIDQQLEVAIFFSKGGK